MIFDVTGAQDHLRVLRIDHPQAAAAELLRLGVPIAAPTVALVGGAASLDEAAQAAIRPLFLQGLVPAVERLAATVIDGGTDSGVMRLIGEARAAGGAGFPLIGVAPMGRVALTDGPPGADTAVPEPHHSHLVLVPGDRWGDESPWLAEVVSVLAAGSPSVTVSVGGGPITIEDLENSVAVGRPIVLLGGTGGTTDAVVAAVAGATTDPRLRRLAGSGSFHVVHVGDGAAALQEAVVTALRPGMRPRGAGTRAPAGPRLGEDGLMAAIAVLELGEAQMNYLTGRWLDQVKWLDRKAGECQRRYYWTRRIVIVCSALVPALLLIQGQSATSAIGPTLPIAAGILSLAVVIAAGWEEFFRYGDRWRHYRGIAEQLKREGWLYIELSGPYGDFPSHARAHASFVLHAEQILGADTEQFLHQIVTEKRQDGAALGVSKEPPPQAP